MKFRHRFTLVSSSPSFRIYESGENVVRLDFLRHMLRVSLTKKNRSLFPTWSVCPGGEDVPAEGRDRLSTEGFETEEPEVNEDPDTVSFTMDGLSFEISLLNFRIRADGEKGPVYSDREILAYNFENEAGTGSWHFTRRFEGQMIFGLGDKSGSVNKSGRRFVISATDSMGFSAESSDPLYKQIPFYICRHPGGSYGLFYDTLSTGEMDFGAFHDNYYEPFNLAHFEEEDLVYYLILGTPGEIVSRFSSLCGRSLEVPEWAFRYCGSTMEYTDAPDTEKRLFDFSDQCEAYGISPGGFYLSSGYTQIGERRCVFHWNREKIPDPEEFCRNMKEKGIRLIPNVKPAFLTDHPLFETLKENGWFLKEKDGFPALFPFWGGMAAYLDFTNPGAYSFWKEHVREDLNRYGYRDIWNDNNEYDVPSPDVWADGFGRPVRACLIRPLFSYLMARASLEACLESGEKRPFNVSRCAIAGTQRVASTWTGDNTTSFRELRFNHRQIMTMALSGFLFFGPDIGGFSGPSPNRELFLRWLQYGVFLPRFVLHSWKPGEPSTMPWLYPDLKEPVSALFQLREKLIPYLYSEYLKCREESRPLLTPVFLKQPDYDVESDCFLCGDRILVCPVFDEGKTETTVTLPTLGKKWRLRGEGICLSGGETITIPCRPDDLPVWFETY